MRRTLAMVLGVVALAVLLCGCGKEGATTEKHSERKGARQTETTGPEPGGPTPRASGDATGKEQEEAQSRADCRLVLYVAKKHMSPKEAEAFSKLLTEMMRSMESLSWPEGTLRNAALGKELITKGSGQEELLSLMDELRLVSGVREVSSALANGSAESKPNQ
jgi:hypothetical protein